MKELQRKQQKSNRLIQELKGDLNRLNIELQNNRRRLNDATRRADTEREKKNAVRRDIETMEAQLKSERRRFAQELEQMEKKRKMDEIRYVDFVSDSFGMDYGGDRRNLSKNSFLFWTVYIPFSYKFCSEFVKKQLHFSVPVKKKKNAAYAMKQCTSSVPELLATIFTYCYIKYLILNFSFSILLILKQFL